MVLFSFVLDLILGRKVILFGCLLGIVLDQIPGVVLGVVFLLCLCVDLVWFSFMRPFVCLLVLLVSF